MQLFIQQLLNGLATGSLYALWAVGYGLVYQVLGLMHFAHGDTLLVGLYVAFSLLSSYSWPLVAALPVVFAVAALVAVVIERVVYRPLVKRGDSVSAFVAALGAAYVLRNAVARIWGTDTRTFPRVIPDKTFVVGGVYIRSTPLITLAVSIVIVAGFTAYLRRARYGQAIVALAQDRSAATLMGIPADRVVALIYALSAVIGSVGALLYITRSRDLRTTVGFTITLKAFVAVILGGIGRIEGALLGGILLGLLETMVTSYVSSLYSQTIVFAVLGVMLIFRPRGLAGRKELAKL